MKFVEFTCNLGLRHDEQVQTALESREDVPIAPPQGRRIVAIEQFVDGCEVATEEGRLQHQLAIMCSDGHALRATRVSLHPARGGRESEPVPPWAHPHRVRRDA